MKLPIAVILLLAALSFIYWFSFMNNTTTTGPGIEKLPIPENAAVATLAGGCFWCIEAAYETGTAGVYEAISGYAEGEASDASYNLVARGLTKHREAAQIYYDPEVIGYAEILNIFWQQIDPTDSGGQFADRGFHYTTAIYYHNEEQKILAEKSKEDLILSKKFDQEIVTEILPFSTFFPAEENHQDFARKRSGYYQRYKYGSGRGGFIEDNWKEE